MLTKTVLCERNSSGRILSRSQEMAPLVYDIARVIKQLLSSACRVLCRALRGRAGLTF